MQLLSVEQISKAYGPVTVLDGVSTHVSAGERVGLVGANGAGDVDPPAHHHRELPADARRVGIGPSVEVVALVARHDRHRVGSALASCNPLSSGVVT